jgi:hypothetical protein
MEKCEVGFIETKKKYSCQIVTLNYQNDNLIRRKKILLK